ncbi:outer membrane protein assembly factor BamB family protein [Nannocystis punicea]|uniref:PQQ-binding-like beta-propeller repeat protein n=1 Tax=Nannocystis punicea TaxID=2995304 RepID=A0ABY7HBG3_9BACT|nr:PQQ-binding-like beta-propeller repeat protein [Nannocystis poenicansa]WAS96613.1 PQQ-binding-like beta-propeller repeat protein [Nannocystis poenicansa]
MSCSPRFTTLAALGFALAGCFPSIVVGETPSDTAGATMDGTTAPTTDTAADNPPTTGPAVCGDGIIDTSEACDDGNDEPNDGCDNACGRSGRVEWTVEPAGLRGVSDLAIDGLGRTILAGFAGNDSFVVALAADGTELWRTPVEQIDRLDVHQDGRIFLGAHEGAIVCLAATGTELWSFQPTIPEELFDRVAGLAVHGDALYSATVESGDSLPGWRLVVRKHRLDTGAALWETRPADELSISAEALVALDDRVVVVGRTLDGQSLLLALDHDGVLLSTRLGGGSRPRTVAAPIGGDDLVLAGFGPDHDLMVQRRGSEFDEIWGVIGDPDDAIADVATDSHQHIALAGFRLEDVRTSMVRMYDGSGLQLWTSTLTDSVDDVDDVAAAAGIGPDFLVVAGAAKASTGTHARLWIRRFALD